MFPITKLLILSSLYQITLALPSLETSSTISKRQNASNPNDVPSGWLHVGCFTDNNAASRTLQQTSFTDRNRMTPRLCLNNCGANFPVTDFAGLEFGAECYCDYDIQGTATQVDDSLCDLACVGDNTLSCGGANLISIFRNSNSVSPPPQNIPKLGNWAFDGCFTDAVGSNPRTLQERFNVAGGVAIDRCINTCDKAGFNISGLEFGTECWCGNAFSLPQAEITAPVSDCSKACQAEPTELCGAANRLAVYTKSVTQSGVVMPRTEAPAPAATPISL